MVARDEHEAACEHGTHARRKECIAFVIHCYVLVAHNAADVARMWRLLPIGWPNLGLPICDTL